MLKDFIKRSNTESLKLNNDYFIFSLSPFTQCPGEVVVKISKMWMVLDCWFEFKIWWKENFLSILIFN